MYVNNTILQISFMRERISIQAKLCDAGVTTETEQDRTGGIAATTL